MSDVKTRDASRTLSQAEPLLIDEKEAARILGFSRRTLQAWRVQGGGPAFIRVSARCVRYRREDLEAWVSERVRRSTSDDGSGWE